MPGGQQPNSWSRNDRLAAWAIAATLFTGVICFIAAIANHETRVFVGLEKPTRPAHIDTSNKPASVTPPVNQPASAVPVPAGQSEKTHPADADTHNNLGYGYYEQKRYAEAEAEFKKAIALNPDLATCHYDLGRSYDEQKRYAEAEQEYKKAIALDPNLASARNNLENLRF